MLSESKYYKQILSKLEKLIRKEFLHLIVIGIQLIILVGLANFTFYSLIEMLSNLSSVFRTILFALFILLLFAAIVYLVVFPLLRYFKLFRRENYFSVANRVGVFFPDLKDDLLNAMQLVTDRKNIRIYSRKLIDQSFKNVYSRAKDIKFEKAIKFERAKRILPYFVGLTIFCIALFFFVPGLQAASYRLVNFNEEFITPPKFLFEVSPGNTEITKGDDIEISARVIGTNPGDVFFAIKNEEEADFKLNKILSDSSGIYSFNLTSVRNSFKYYAQSDEVRSELFEIKVIDRPVVKTLELSIMPPAYSGIPQTVQRDNGNVSSLVGTKIEFEISSTKPLKEAYLEFSDSTTVDLSVNENRASGFFRIKSDDTYTIALLDQNDNENASPIDYQVKALYDAYPVIELIAPNKNIPLAIDNRVNLIANVSDDYGFSKLTLNYRLSASKFESTQSEFSTVEIPIDKMNNEISVNYIWNLTRMSLGVDDAVTYYLEIFDNDFVSGPKSAKTPAFTVRIPSLDELLTTADEIQNQAELELEETLKKAENLQDKLEEIDQELKKDDEKLTWEEKEKIESALEQFQELQESVDKINDRLSEMRQNLHENNLLSEETMEKYFELQELMDELTSDEMKKALEQLQQMLQKMNRDMTQDALQNFKIDEERFKNSIERTLNLLKRMQIEQKVDELIKRTEKLLEEQSDLKNQTEKSDLLDDTEGNDLSSKQDKMTKDLENLEEAMKNLQDKMSELEDMPMEEMNNMQQEFQNQKNQQLSKNASQSLKQCQKQKALNFQQQLSENMSQMNQMMEDMQQSMQQQNQVQTFTDMMKILDNLINLSKEQEDLKQQSENLESNSSEFNELVKEQNELSNNLQNLMNQMANLSQKTFAITPEMGKALGKAKQQMQMSMQSMQNRNGSFSAIQQTEAMENLNKAAIMMKGSMEAMMQGGSGSGMMSLMQQLQQLSGQQMNLNNMTQMLRQMQQGGLTSQQQLELQRLAQQQELIRKSANELNKEAQISGESKKLPADLNDIINKMQEVITDMNTEKLDDDLVQKQEYILSKMLDAQRSINQRDFEKQRESKTGQTSFRESPGGLIFSDDTLREKILDELNRAIKEGYTRDYEELIRKYFNTLQEENIQN